MHNLIYLSAASYLFSDEELMDILNKSRVKNRDRNITGLLLYHEGSIFQILEGEQAAVRALFDIISRDKRHRGIIKMIDLEVQQRSFKNWSMGFKRLSNEEWSMLSGYLNMGDKDALKQLGAMESGHIATLLKSFVNVNMNLLHKI